MHDRNTFIILLLKLCEILVLSSSPFSIDFAHFDHKFTRQPITKNSLKFTFTQVLIFFFITKTFFTKKYNLRFNFVILEEYYFQHG